MRFTKWGEYGILFCVHLGREKSQVGAAELGAAHNIPTQYAQQILHRLRKGGIITSTRGPRGGFQLVKAPEDITMKDILTAAEGSTFELMCHESPLFEACGSESHCTVQLVWRELKSKIDEALEGMTLASLLARPDESTLISFPTRLKKAL